MRSRSGHHFGDRGATAITIAISLILLMGIAAVALDLSAAWNEDRQDQTSSDLSAVSGALSYAHTQTNQSVVTNVLENARSNLTAQYSGPNDPGWVAAWRNCTDPDHLVVTYDEPVAWNSIGTPNPGNELQCISSNGSYFRVKVPLQDTETTFGKILGVDTIQTTAYAVVELFEGGTGLLPFAILGDAGAGEVCLDTGSSPQPPCDKNDRGSFGVLLPPQWGSAITSQSCSANGNSEVGIPNAITNGVDHLMLSYPAASWGSSFGDPDGSYNTGFVKSSSVNVDLCTTTSGPVAAPADQSHEPDVLPINGAVVDTGNSSRDEIEQGLISNMTFGGNPSKLQRSGGLHTVDLYDGNTVLTDVDNTPLWLYIDTGLTFGVDVPASCAPGVITAGADEFIKADLMAQCLEDYEAGSGYTVLFDDDVRLSPRFAVAPQLWHNNLGSGLSYRAIREFRPVYINGVDLMKTNKGEWWYPDETDPGPVCYDKDANRVSPPGCKQMDVDQVTAYLLPKGSFSALVAAVYPGLDLSSFQPTIFE